MFEIITIGSSLLDTFVQSKKLTVTEGADGMPICQIIGDKIVTDEYHTYTGGGASNTAVGFARMGFKTAVVSEMGQDVLSRVLIADFEQEGVKTDLLIQEKKEQTGGSIILSGAQGVRTVLVHRGAASMLDPEDIPVQIIQKAGWVHMSSVGGKIQTLETIFTVVKENNVRLSWNPGTQEIQLLLSHKLQVPTDACQLFFVNAQEWEMLGPVHQRLREIFTTIIVTQGGEGGSIFHRSQEPISYTAQSVTKVVDVTGAGDAFIVGYVSALLRKETVATACQWGAKNSASVVQYFGAKTGLLLHKDI